jgi:hypothetical protein
MTVIPADRDRIPASVGYFAAIICIAAPVNASALLEVLRFGGGHCDPPLRRQPTSQDIDTLMEGTVPKLFHDNPDGDALLLNTKPLSYGAYHCGCYIN